MRRSLTQCAIILICACKDEGTGPITAAELCARKDEAWLEMPATLIDDHFEVIARLLPGGFGGLTVTYMYLKEPAKADTARKTAAVLAGCGGTFLAGLDFVQSVDVRQGDYDWVELRRWYLALKTGPWEWISADMDEAVNRLHFEFETQEALERFRTLAVGLQVPLDALRLTVVGAPPWR